MEKYKVMSRGRAWRVLILIYLGAWFGFMADLVAYSGLSGLTFWEYLIVIGVLAAFAIATYSFIRACRDHTEHYSSSVLNSSISFFWSQAALLLFYVVH